MTMQKNAPEFSVAAIFYTRQNDMSADKNSSIYIISLNITKMKIVVEYKK
jgi:hypothetical protein